MIYRDLVERYGVRNVAFLKMLMKFLIANVSNAFSIHSYHKAIRSEMPVSRDTVMEYLGYLEEVELISLLPVFSYSLKTQQVNPRKVYTLDNGLRNAVSFRFSPDEGRLAENLVHGQLRRAAPGRNAITAGESARSISSSPVRIAFSGSTSRSVTTSPAGRSRGSKNFKKPRGSAPPIW